MDLSRAITPRVNVSLRFLLLLGCAGAISHQAMAAGTLPSGGHFVAGTGGISSSGAATMITQSSKRGIIDWKSFSVGKGNTVQFDNGLGATLNRVTGGNMSAIAGQIKATGSIYLINPNGVVVGAGGKVLTGGTFVASTRDTSNSQFMAGGAQDFAGTSNGAVVNDGAVVSQNGSVVLVGHAVTNNGTVDAANGTAVLASGNRVLMTDASGPDRVYVAGGGGDTTNDGQVKAAAVELAAAGGNVYTLAGNRTGLVQATGTKTVDGQIWLTAPDGAVDVAGTLDARGDARKTAAVMIDAGKSARLSGRIDVSGLTPGHTGGTVAVTGGSVDLTATARIDARGYAGGGKVRIGGGAHGADPNVRDARNTQIAAGALIDASATGNGNGGMVTVWSDDSTVFQGRILANGGFGGGNGGFAEVSTHGVLTYAGFTDLRTSRGTIGTLLLDPTDVEISGSLGDSHVTGSSPFKDDGTSSGLSILSTTTLNTALAAADVIVSTTSLSRSSKLAGTIVVDADATVTMSHDLTLDATGGIVINGFIDTGSNLLVLNAGGTIPNTATTTPWGTTTSHIVVPTGCAGMSICESAAAAIQTGTNGALTGSAAGGVSLAGVNNIVINLLAFSTDAGGANGDFTLTSQGNGLNIKGAVDAGAGTVTAATTGSLTIGSGGSVSGGAVKLAALGNFVNDAGAGAISTTAGGRWLVYSTNPNLDTDDGLAASYIQYGASYDIGTASGTAPAASGNGFLYSASGALTLTGVAKTYDGTNGLTTSPTTFTTSGAVAGDTIVLAGSPVGQFASADTNADTGTLIDVTVSGLTVTATRGGVTVFGYTIAPVTNDPIGTINRKTLTATLTGTIDKTYDGTNIAALGNGNFSLSGFVGGQGATVTQTVGTYATSNAGTGIVVTTGLNPSEFNANGGTLLSNYITPVVATGTGTIGKAALTVTLTGTVDKTYDGTAAATLTSGNYVLGGVIGADVVALNDPTTGSYDTAAAGTGKLVTVTGLGLTGAADGNYTVAGSVSGAIGEIDRKALTVSLTGTVEKTYDGTTAATLTSGNYVLSGVIGGDVVAVNDLATGSYDTANAGTGKLVTVTGLGLTGAAAGNYVVAGSVSGAIGQIDRKILTATLIGTIDKTYDGTNIAALNSGNFSLSGFAGGQGATVTQTVGTYASANAGSGIVVTTGLDPSEFVANGGTLLSNYITPVVATGTGTIGKAALTVSLVGIVDKTYDGTRLATLGSDDYVLNGVIGGDAVALNDPTSGRYDTANVGDGKLVTVTGLGLTGAAAGNYTVAGSVSGAIGEIDRKLLTISLVGTVEKTYDGTRAATLTGGNFELGGVIGGDAVTLNHPTGGTYDTANAGSEKLVTVSGLVLSGADAGNYTITKSASGAVGEIDRKLLTVSLTGTVEKTYDGTTAATLTGGNFELGGVIGGDAVALNDPAIGRYDTANAGDGKLVTVSGLVLSGADAGNYTITKSASGAVGEIDPKRLTVSLTGMVEKTYDGTTAAALTAGNFELGGVLGGDAVTLNDPTSGRYDTANVGNGKLVTVSGLSLTGAAAGNYTVAGSVFGAVGEIDRKLLTVSLTGTVEKTYDGTTAATLTGGNYLLGGVISGDAVTLNYPVDGTYGTANAGTGELVTVSGLSLTGAAAGNYTITKSASGAVGQIDRAALTVTLGNVSTVYDGAGFSGGGGASFSGFVDGETSAVLGGKLSYGGASQGAVNAGTYAIDGHGLTSGNYTITYDAGTLTIDPKVITAELTGTVTKQYDGNDIAMLTSGNYLLSGVIAGDTVMLNDPAKGTYASAAVGTGIAVTADGLALSGTQAGNYRLASMTVTGDIGTITRVPAAPPVPVIPPFITVIPPLPSPAPANAEAAHSLVVPQVDLSDMAKLSGCSGEDFVAVVPEENGHVGAVVVESEGNKTLLHAAYAGCANSKPVMTNAQEVQNLFGGALAARPTPPAYYDLYYNSGSVTLVPNALAAFDKVFADIMRRKAAEVVVAGYTDTIGNPRLNDRLSLERAQAVSKLLVARGLAPGSVTAIGRGERDPQVPTKEQVAEQKNRRVEITVR
jgi:filamentous hemagglutinin family protein